ncbi:PQQ-dependent sugar dehydrogenase [Shimia sp. SK013]|uniref:PQQ-dependent sugar dehydrogenase n=1 Tax=Shimia sp. SK013 TaxID=1389006 RepID=UPI001F4C533F|nr:PQQ-dependent sugar dehydrogenase [Shimia sp. SK013]
MASDAAEAMTFEAVVTKLKTPWSFGFLPDGGLLITELGGKLIHIGPNGGRSTIAGVPKSQTKGQGGLLDVLVPRDFEQRREIFLTFAKKQPNGEGTAVARGQLNVDAKRLSNVKVIFEISEGSSGGRHFGSRLVEANDGTLFVSVGDRGDRPSAQDLDRHNGSILRITRSGDPASGNPYLGRSDARDETWSFGHRNPQGMALDLEGLLWAVEHGAKGGDEVNQIEKGANYGWPVISYGQHYSGGKIGEGTSKAGMKQPAHYWDPSIAPSGMMIYSGKLWPKWRGHMFVGSLKFDYISVLCCSNLTETDQIKSNETKRVRDIREGPEGGIWFLSEDRGTLYRMRPTP